MNETTRKWIEAGRILQTDTKAIVACPECSIGTLIIKDEPVADGNNQTIDRYLICNNCGKWNVITMNISQEN